MIRGVLFDLDGTLVDHDGAAEIALGRCLGPDFSDRTRRRWAELSESAMTRYLAGELTFAEQRRLRVTALAAELGWGTWDAARADAWFAEYLRHYESAWRVYPDVRPVLDALAGLRLGVLTNGDAGQQREKLRRVGLSLPMVLTSSEAGAAKPDALIFTAGCDRLGLPPYEVAYVGDRMDTDAVAATDAGLRGIWLNRSAAAAPSPVPAIRGLADLPALLSDG